MKKGRRMVRVALKEIPDWEYRVSLDQMKKDIQKLEELGATHMTIENTAWYDGDMIVPYFERLETDEEFNYRLNREKLEIERARESAIKTISHLKTKYKL